MRFRKLQSYLWVCHYYWLLTHEILHWQFLVTIVFICRLYRMFRTCPTESPPDISIIFSIICPYTSLFVSFCVNAEVRKSVVNSPQAVFWCILMFILSYLQVNVFLRRLLKSSVLHIWAWVLCYAQLLWSAIIYGQEKTTQNLCRLLMKT